jgi:hypothetical protein
MSLKQVWEWLLDSVKVIPEFEKVDSSSGNLSVEEIKDVSSLIREQEEWWFFEARSFELFRENKTGKLIWIVEFLLQSVNDYYATGARAVVVIDDERGLVISKTCTLR